MTGFDYMLVGMVTIVFLIFIVTDMKACREAKKCNKNLERYLKEVERYIEEVMKWEEE